MNKHRLISNNNKSVTNSSLGITKCFLLSIAASLTILLLTGCADTIKAVVLADRHNPESVLQAYFSAWERGDWSDQVSFMDGKYALLAPEPIDSIRMIEIKPIPDSSSTERTYRVIFEIEVKGRGVSMQSGRYDWKYYLTWDANRDSWLITNYGSG